MLNPNGESSVAVCLETLRPPSTLIDRVFRAFPDPRAA